MKSNANHNPTCTTVFTWCAYGLLGPFLSVAILSCAGRDTSSAKAHLEPGVWLPASETGERRLPPDLHGCTRAELRYLPSVVDHFFSMAKERRLLDAEELNYLKSLDSITVEDPATLATLARDVERAVYKGRSIGGGPPRIREMIEIACYRDSELLASFIAHWNGLLTEAGEHFDNPGRNAMLTIMEEPVPQIRSLVLRQRCAAHLWRLHHYIFFYFQDTREYPSPEAWCDLLMEVHHRRNTDDRIERFLVCPGAKGDGGRCHYAMNPDCAPTSPPDTVLLFETTGGWNQHGGPELFTFDNHDPPGGCVMLNDADLDGLRGPTVLFVRTREELQQLRWK
ncbi:MAG TPA: hypothetical protein P5242_04795 [Sedimentisphaerales bacterium]|nr:hypothetical protein [Sedimentisphaerales bacterium]